jgi:3-phytase
MRYADGLSKSRTFPTTVLGVVAVLTLTFVLAITSTGAAAVGVVVPFAETPGVGGPGDKADDPAIAPDVVIGTKKGTGGGLFVYNGAAEQLANYTLGDLNNVDVRTGFPLGGDTVTLVGASDVGAKRLLLYKLDGSSLTQIGSVPAHSDLYGFCLYRSATGSFYAFGTGKKGTVGQYLLDGSSGTVTATKVREFDVGGSTEGCAADDAAAALYVAEEDAGLYRYVAEPIGGSERVVIDTTAPGGNLVADVEGVAVSGSWIVVSSQGESSFAVYDRVPPHTYRGEFQIGSSGSIDAVTASDGIELDVDKDLFVAHDGRNGSSGSNFKYVRWSDVLGALAL